MTAGPDGVRDPVPNTWAASKSLCTKRVLWIVGSTDRHLPQLFHPGINARSSGGGCLSASPRVIVTHAVWAIRNSVPAETARRFNRLKLTEIGVTDHLQSFGDGAVS
jgi:hypothetical protein